MTVCNGIAYIIQPSEHDWQTAQLKESNIKLFQEAAQAGQVYLGADYHWRRPCDDSRVSLGFQVENVRHF